MLTVLQEKLAEAHALAIAASTATEQVGARVADAALRHELREMRREAEETRARCLDVEGRFGEALSDEMRAHAISVKEKVADMAAGWFKAGTGPLASWSFLAMGEAAEVAVWRAVETLAAKAPPDGIVELAEWALPIQERHLETALAGAVRLAGLADPMAPRWG